ncbi:hypothetical protein DSM104443_03594 [Usitatibacter rugosus]|uniref:UPF0276 protein DSM104443_03594 n=1 Tax=Usitatibacter rugosus TaxID=2732067 RepID=A0A6M4H072_9PROT|nr:DUF692 domain-containing protein [Usitatibacter rugosus]QJR12508.1 hypothetical protein DSM104443_03594 [Usitatibacter rugosus]
MPVPRAPEAGYAGIGLRAPHYEALARTTPRLSFLEVHSENFFGDGGPPLAWLERFRADYPLSLHGVGLSLGTAGPLDETHLAKLCALVERFEPALVSEHLCWGSIGGRFANDLLPLPYTREALANVVAQVERVQERLGQRILVENVSSYLEFEASTIPEGEFLAEVSRASGCGVLLDVNNIYVNAMNHGFDAIAYLDAIPADAVGEIHLAGYDASEGLLIDTHGARVSSEVWALYTVALDRLGPRPTLIEWDTDIPELEVLLAEADRATQLLGRARAPRGVPATA